MKNENKKEFIRDLETALILYSRENIKGLEYWVSCSNGAEYITVKYTTGYEKTINITGDSCLAIMKDLYNAMV